jgi:tripartite-type tricarboxylate transporter receptor subunit TctC
VKDDFQIAMVPILKIQHPMKTRYFPVLAKLRRSFNALLSATDRGNTAQCTLSRADMNHACVRSTLRKVVVGCMGLWILLGANAAAVAASTTGGLSASSYPVRQIKIICAFPPGNSSDIAARLLAKELEKKWGQTIIVENHPGASGTIAASLVKDAPADGYTLLMTSTSVAINSAVLKNLPYDLYRDFSALNFVNSISAVLLVSPSFPGKTLDDLMRLAKADPGKFSYGHPGVGTIQNMSAKFFMQQTGVKLTEVPYKGSVQAITDIIGGRLTMMFEADNSAYGLVKSGKLRALATTGAQRYFGLPDVKTMKEQGTDVNVAGFTILLAPKAVPADVVAKINHDVNAALQSPAVVAGMNKIGLAVAEPLMPAAQTQTVLLSDRTRWENVAKAAGIQKE